MKIGFSMLAAVVLSVSATVVQATTFTYVGTISEVSDSVGSSANPGFLSSFSIGQTVSVSLTFDETTIGAPGASGGTLYSGALTNFTFSSGGQTLYTNDSAGTIRITNNGTQGTATTLDSFITLPALGTGPAQGELAVRSADLTFLDLTGSALSSEMLPAAILDPSLFALAVATLGYRDPSAISSVEGFFRVRNLTPVPVPAALWLFGTALLALFGGRQIGSRQHRCA